ncbi:GNAT family N-acetyltransferase [Chloroflexota bacterium]
METKTRIHLSSLENEQITQYMVLSDDPELIASMGWRPFGPGDKERFIQFTRVLSLPGLESDKAIVFSIIHTSDNKAIGYTVIKGISEIEARAEVGIAIMEMEYRGQGYGTEALGLVVDHAFHELNLTTVGLTVFPSNHRAIRAYEKVGFRKTGVLMDSWLLPNGRYVDMCMMELSRDSMH